MNTRLGEFNCCLQAHSPGIIGGKTGPRFSFWSLSLVACYYILPVNSLCCREVPYVVQKCVSWQYLCRDRYNRVCPFWTQRPNPTESHSHDTSLDSSGQPPVSVQRPHETHMLTLWLLFCSLPRSFSVALDSLERVYLSLREWSPGTGVTLERAPTTAGEDTDPGQRWIIWRV